MGQEAIRIIKDFVELLAKKRSVFPLEALADLPQLEQNLAGLSDNDPYPVAETVVNWCQKYTSIKEALRTVQRYEVGDEEIPPTDPKYEEMMTRNITLLKQTVQSAQLPLPPTTDSDKNKQNG
ncbi:hypothetical protein SAMD00079811_20890 [Scytonema sp. HK-05]|uniref:hypothetical protein n=1 Tax=Scytonema sp. HK-05 TaxID=1137095 RepID=UPI00093636A2|nr:hypothetical protein [Scytonema sp. HK-05]OKH53171.1 hypothetical protein NIES2130_30845 [Scytonema sp. HK-05]BAY44489.1 hypothetical protein SAMD00079811_20890 [Scytonema sp. HK-05]